MAPISKYLIQKVTNLITTVSQDKAKNLYKLQNVNGNNKIFDKELKSTYLS